MQLHLQALDNFILSPSKHSYSGRTAILICHSKGTDKLTSDARRPHESSISPAKCMCLCTMSVPSNSNSNFSVFGKQLCFRILEKRVCHNTVYSHFLPFFFLLLLSPIMCMKDDKIFLS